MYKKCIVKPGLLMLGGAIVGGVVQPQVLCETQVCQSRGVIYAVPEHESGHDEPNSPTRIPLRMQVTATTTGAALNNLDQILLRIPFGR